MTRRDDEPRRAGVGTPLLPGMESPRRAVPPPAPTGDPLVDWLRVQADRAMNEGRVDEALPVLERLVGLARDPAGRCDALMLLGEACEHREEWLRAAAAYRSAVEADPSRPEPHYRLGLAHVQVENSRAATEALLRAADLSPDEPEIARALGVALAGTGEDEEADRWLRRAAALAPDSLPVLEALAAHALRMGRFTECSEAIRRAGELAPDNPIVRRLAKETSYLVELAALQAPEETPPPPKRRPLRVVLSGAPGEVERRFVASMTDAGFLAAQVANARDAWRDFLAVRSPRIRNPAEHAAAIEFLVARLDFVDGCAREEVARRHGVDPAAVARIHEDVVQALGVEMFDARYCTQQHPARHVGEEAQTSGLPADEIFQALLEDEYREYCASHDRTSTLHPRMEREEFEDASVEYGALLTRELMGLTLSRRERVRKRELERLLLVT